MAAYIVSTVRKQRHELNIDSQLTSSLFSSRPQPMERCCPHSGWVFPAQLHHSENALQITDTPRSYDSYMVLSHTKLTRSQWYFDETGPTYWIVLKDTLTLLLFKMYLSSSEAHGFSYRSLTALGFLFSICSIWSYVLYMMHMVLCLTFTYKYETVVQLLRSITLSPSSFLGTFIKLSIHTCLTMGI